MFGDMLKSAVHRPPHPRACARAPAARCRPTPRLARTPGTARPPLGMPSCARPAHARAQEKGLKQAGKAMESGATAVGKSMERGATEASLRAKIMLLDRKISDAIAAFGKCAPHRTAPHRRG